MIALLPRLAANRVSRCLRIDYLQRQTAIFHIRLTAAFQENFKIG
jgi:hypothetical protein